MLLFAAALVISGFTILRGVEPFDEGLTLQAARRVADDQLPYRDFLWAYGPAHPYLLAGLFKLFGTSLLWWRIVRVLVDAGVALLVYALVRREAPMRVALVAWLTTACAMAQPTGANPFAPALLFTLAAVLVASRAETRRGLLAAGALCGLAAAWRIDFGAYALVGAAATAAADPRTRGVLSRIAPVAAVCAGVTALVYLPFVITDGPADAWRDLVGRSLHEGHNWHLPFPLGYDGRFRLWPPGSLAHDLKDVLAFYEPLLLVIGVIAAVIVIVRRRLQRLPAIVGLTALGLTYIAYLLSRTDEFHSTPLIVVLAAVLPLLALHSPMRAAAPLAVLLLALLAYGASNRLSALFEPPQLATVHVAVADGVKAPPGEGHAIEQMVRDVQRRVPAGEPIYTVTRRADLVRINDPLIYVLTDRDNPTRQDFGLQTKAPAQRAIVTALERAKPKVIVRWSSPESTKREPNDRGKPTGVHTLDRWLAANYRAAERFGFYEILVPA
ncbi:MAG: hypothetical protein QOJ29_242 [Thermoleophilaceae bacterium]|nr:hypothetical protein [Thermoleophilaceae bacterium]